ncbi:MAG: PorV/PorQ family protein, partial [bacterium]
MTRVPAFLLLLCGVCASLEAFGIGDVGTTTADFLKLGSGARSEALGEAYVAISDDSDALAYNPAGMAQDLEGELSASHALWFEGLAYDELSVLIPDSKGGAWGANFGYLSSPEIARTFLNGDGEGPTPYTQDGSFSPYDMLASFGYARPLLGGLLGGASIKLLDQSLDTQSAVGVAADLGLLWETPVAGLDFGLSLQNLGPPVSIQDQASPLPFTGRGGAAYRVLNGALLLTAEGDLPYDDAPVFAAGAEFDIADRFFPRVGWRYDGQFNPWTLGFGLRYGVWGLDLSAVPYGVLGMTYRATVDWSFGGPGAGLTASLAYASPRNGRSALLDANMSAPAKVRTWAVIIYNSARPSRVVRTLSGFGPPEGPLAWDGRDNDGAPVPEGVYWAALAVRYLGGRSVHSPYTRLRVIDSAPSVELAFDTFSVNPYARGQAFVPTAFRPRLARGGALASWRLDILDSDGRVFRTFTGKGPLPGVVVWDGKGNSGEDFISARRYAARLTVEDVFGGRAQSPALGFFAVF